MATDQREPLTQGFIMADHAQKHRAERRGNLLTLIGGIAISLLMTGFAISAGGAILWSGAGLLWCFSLAFGVLVALETRRTKRILANKEYTVVKDRLERVGEARRRGLRIKLSGQKAEQLLCFASYGKVTMQGVDCNRDDVGTDCYLVLLPPWFGEKQPRVELIYPASVYRPEESETAEQEAEGQ